MKNKEITSLNNPELKFLISIRKNKIRRNENKSIAEGYRENVQLINSNYEIDTLYICSELFVGNNNFELIDQFKIKQIRIVKLSKKVFNSLSYRDKPDGILSLFMTKNSKLKTFIYLGQYLLLIQ